MFGIYPFGEPYFGQAGFPVVSDEEFIGPGDADAITCERMVLAGSIAAVAMMESDAIDCTPLASASAITIFLEH